LRRERGEKRRWKEGEEGSEFELASIGRKVEKLW